MKKEQTIAEFPIPDTRECECRLLNTMMLTPECVFQVTNVIKREMFSEENKQVWDAITDAFANHETINPVTISTRVNRRNFSENIITSQPVYGNIELQDLMASFVDTYIKRRAYILAIDTLSKVNANIPPSEITSSFDNFSKKVYSGLADDGNDTATEISEKIELSLKAGKATRVQTSIKQLDFLTYGGFNAGNLIILAARPSAGKSQPIDAKVLTPEGYREIGSLSVGDKVIGRNGKEQEVLGVFPQGVRPVYRVTMNDGASVMCDEEHIWSVNDMTSHHKDAYMDMTLKTMIERGLRAKRTPSRMATNRNGVLKYRIPKVNPIEFSEKEFEIHPYLLGVLLGDGSLTYGYASISTPDSDYEMIERLESLLPGGYHFNKDRYSACPRYVIAQDDKNAKNGFIRIVRSLGIDKLSRCKFVPEAYMLGSVKQRIDLLRGLMDTDGSAGKDGSISFSTTSRLLAENVVSLVRSLGGFSYIREFDRRDSGKPVEYSVVVSIDICPFYLKRKAERWHPQNRSRYIMSADRVEDMECVCIYVSNEDHLYVTENYIVTHNTSISLQMAQCAAKAGTRSLFLSLEMTSEELVQRLLLSTGRLTPEQLFSKNVDWGEFEKAKAIVCNNNLLINDKVGGIDEICNRIRLSVQVEGIRFVVIDYLGLIPFDKRLNTATAIGELTRKLKCTAKECGIPILLLCQLNRSSVAENRSPQMHDLRDSGAIEQDADIILMLERAKDDTGTIIDNTIDLWVRKNRSGRCTFDAPIRLYGNKVYSNFREEPYEEGNEEMPF